MYHYPMHYKIADLEKRPGLPKNLGTIENYIKDKYTFSKAEFYLN
jgi:hypothetical protein